MQVAKRIPFEDPNTLNLVRLGYILSNVIIAVIYFYIGLLVKRKNGLYNLSTPHPDQCPNQSNPPSLPKANSITNRLGNPAVHRAGTTNVYRSTERDYHNGAGI